jgi:hypothetical protein
MFLFLAQIRSNEFELRAFELLSQLVLHCIAGQQEQHAPKSAVWRASPGHVGELFGFRLLRALRPAHDGGILQRDQLLLFQLLNAPNHLLRPVSGVELQNG